ncbi:phage holin family protein [Halobacteriovorax sp. HLS]|uniref:phage holin family protein n=1 Tax=Halobacteriovorax sp. HLS TaxID=2234000 RepID=UPI000FDB6387|nr:phage holin family protein [Halobacteriovorax sp. HLS]
MKLFKIKSILIFTLATFIFMAQSFEAKAEMDGRVKALGTMALYGTVGGALLGTASLAFGTNGRAIAQGASLGLYAGIIFGTYVVVSHSMKKRRYDAPMQPKARPDNYYPDDSTSPYQDSGANNGGQNSDDSWSFYNRTIEMTELSSDFGFRMNSLNRFANRKGSQRPPLYLNFLNYRF